MIFEFICQYDIYLRLSFIEIAKELYLKYQLSISIFNTKVFENKNK